MFRYDNKCCNDCFIMYSIPQYFLRNSRNLVVKLYLLQNEPIMISPVEFACPFCIKIMKTRKDMKRHIRIHTGEKPFVCKYCHECFRLKCILDKHIIKYHEKPNVII